MYVVDGSNEARIPESRDYLATVLAEPALKDLPLLLYVNKADKGNAVARRAVAELGLTGISDREIFI